MNAIANFIEVNSSALLEILIRRNSGKLSLSESLRFVENLLDDFSVRFHETKLDPPSPKERTFWSTLYSLEEAIEVSIELAANPDQSASIRPYMKMVEENLNKLEQALKNNKVLEGFYATRPGEWDEALDHDLDEEELLMMDI